MTGRRRAAGREHDGRFAPLADVARADRIRSAVRARYAAAQTELDRLVAALDYTRSSAAAAERAGVDDTDAVLADATRALMAAGNALTAALAREARR